MDLRMRATGRDTRPGDPGVRPMDGLPEPYEKTFVWGEKGPRYVCEPLSQFVLASLLRIRGQIRACAVLPNDCLVLLAVSTNAARQPTQDPPYCSSDPGT